MSSASDFKIRYTGITDSLMDSWRAQMVAKYALNETLDIPIGWMQHYESDPRSSVVKEQLFSALKDAGLEGSDMQYAVLGRIAEAPLPTKDPNTGRYTTDVTTALGSEVEYKTVAVDITSAVDETHLPSNERSKVSLSTRLPSTARRLPAKTVGAVDNFLAPGSAQRFPGSK